MTEPLTAEQLDKLRSMGEPMSLSEVPKYLRAFIYGDPGVGKTDFLVQVVKELNLNPIWITTDSGWTTIFKYTDVASRTWKVPFDSFAQIRMMVQAREEGIEPFCNYDTICLDTASGAIDNMLRIVVKQKPLPKEQQDPNVEAWGHYRMVESALKDTVNILKKSTMHVLFTAHIRDPSEKDKEKKRFAIRPAGPEACYRVIAQEVNLLGWLYPENRTDERLIQFKPTLQETAKTQIPTVDSKTYNVTQVPELISKFINS